jgi:hypothetical protein
VLSGGWKEEVVQRGQSEHPRPEPVRRTAAPLKTIRVSVTSAARATFS